MMNEGLAAFNNRVVHDLKSRSSPGVVFYLLLTFIIIFTDDFYKRQPHFCLWFGILTSIIFLLRMIHLYFFERMETSHPSLNHTIFFINVGIAAIVYGMSFAYLMLLDGEHSTKLMIAIFMAGLCAGGVVAFIPDLRLATFFSVAMLGPAIVLMSITQTNLPLAFAFLIFAIYIVFIANRGNREYWQALENEQLLIQKSEELKYLSRIDSLTGLFNRRHFDERLDQEWKKTTRVQQTPSVIICDIDYFKKINDQYGHQAGDEFLKLTASLLKTVFKRDTDIVARFGGEEFIVLLTDSTPEMVLSLAEELRRRMSEQLMPFKGMNVSATISLGIATASPALKESRDALIARADNALYQAKRQGRNRTVVASQRNVSEQPFEPSGCKNCSSPKVSS